jgi:hypothetical protein
VVSRSHRSPRRATSITLLSILAAICLIASGCSSSPSVRPTTPASASPSTDPSLTPVPGGSTVATPPPAGVPTTQTDAEWGRIWDALPPSFPLPPDAVPTDTREGPVSASLAVGMSAEQAADFMVARLTERGSRVDRQADPSEDGSVVIDALGPEPACEIQVRLTPLSGTTSMVVMFGAGCPFE